MKIFVLTAKRPDRQITSDLLCEAGVEHTVVADPGDAIPPHDCRYVDDTATCDGIRGKRNYVLDNARKDGFDKILMLDDDLKFRRRTVEGNFVSTEGPTGPAYHIPSMIFQLEQLLSSHAHVGILDEFMSQAQPRGFKNRGRYNQVLGYNLSMFPDTVRFRLPVNEEHDVHLQLGALGLAPAISCEWTKSSKIYAKGGCSTWRTPEVELAGHVALADNFPDLVKVVAAKSLSGCGIRVKWSKAVKS